LTFMAASSMLNDLTPITLYLHAGLVLNRTTVQGHLHSHLVEKVFRGLHSIYY